MADFQTQFKPASPEPICSSWMNFHSHPPLQTTCGYEWISCYVCVCVRAVCGWVCGVSGEKVMTFYNHLCTHTPKTNPFYLYCMLFICSPWHPPPWCDLSETQHSRVLSQCEEEESFFRNSSNQCADVASYYTLYFHVHVKKITLCS